MWPKITLSAVVGVTLKFSEDSGLRCWIPNPGIPSSKLLCGSKVDLAFHPSKVDKMVKGQLPPRSASSLEAVEPYP